MKQDEIIEMARHIASTFGTRMCDENGDTHGEELYAMGLDDIVDTIKLVAAKEREKLKNVALFDRWYQELDIAVLSEREACAKVCDNIHAKHEAADVFSSYAEAIRARGEA